MKIGQFTTYLVICYFHYEILSSNFVLKNIWGQGNFTKDVTVFFTILHGAKKGRQPFKGVS